MGHVFVDNSEEIVDLPNIQFHVFVQIKTTETIVFALLRLSCFVDPIPLNYAG